jgi:hypothetical protein
VLDCTIVSRWSSFSYALASALAILLAPSVAAQDTERNADSRVVIDIPTTDEGQRAMVKVFEQFVRAVTVEDFAQAHDLLLPAVAKEVTTDHLRSRYRILEAEYGLLQRIETRGAWFGKPSPNRVATVVVTHVYESKRVLFTYTLQTGRSGWRVVGFEPGGKTPAGTMTEHQP